VSEHQLAALYREADVFVLASRFEGYGMAYAEAIAHGLPVIGTRVGAVPDTVPAGAGILVPPDDVAALAAGLGDMIADAGLRRRCSDAACRASMPGWEAAAQAFLDLLSPCLPSPAKIRRG
jgi:glycosyltransferase involved in cell wall biosynthesis